MTRKLLMTLVCCLVMVLAIVPLASAKGPKGPSGPAEEPTDELIYGCYKKNNGQLRIVENPGQCRPSELPISWNQVGPQGPAGPQGPEGPQGPPGPPPNLWIARQIDPVSLTDTGSQVLSLIVPAGTYAISAKVSLANADSLIQPASCALSTGDVSGVVLGGGADDNEQVISLLDAAIFESATAITLSCATVNGEATNGVLSAVEVEIPVQ